MSGVQNSRLIIGCHVAGDNSLTIGRAAVVDPHCNTSILSVSVSVLCLSSSFMKGYVYHYGNSTGRRYALRIQICYVVLFCLCFWWWGGSGNS